MKPKILAVKYFDWVLIGLLSLALLYVIYISFLSTESAVTKLGEEIQRSETAVRSGMSSSYSPEYKTRNLITELTERFEHLPVISPYLRNPFSGAEGMDYELRQMMVEQEIVIHLTGTRLLDVIDPSDIVQASIAYDNENETSTVTFLAVKAGQDTVRIRDERDQVHSWPIVVVPGRQLLPPNPPYDVVFVSRPPQEIRRAAEAPLEREPPVVLIYFQPDNPVGPSSTVGYTTAARILRKPADAPDIEYAQIHTGLLAPIQNRDQIEAIMKRFRITVPVIQGRPAVGPGGEIIPPEAQDINRAAAADVLVETPPVGSFVYLDETVDEGENYIYKIETLSTTEGAQPRPTEEPYILPEPLEILALVRFRVASVTSSTATLVLSRVDPDTNQQITQELRLMPGMPIGRPVRMEQTANANVDRRLPTQYKYVDFSTNCILVAVLPNYRNYDYRIPMRLDRTTGEPVYDLSSRRVGQIIYLTPRGFLRIRGVGTEAEMLEQERRGGMRGGAPGAVPGGMPRGGIPGGMPGRPGGLGGGGGFNPGGPY